MLLVLVLVLLTLLYVFMHTGVIPDIKLIGGATLTEQETVHLPQETPDSLEEIIKKNDVQNTKTTESLDKINKKLDNTGELSEEEHDRLQRLAEKTKKVSDELTAAEEELKSKLDRIKQEVQEKQHPETDSYYKRKLAQQRAQEQVAQELEHTTSSKDTLINHGNRLASLEKYLQQLKQETMKNQSILSDIRYKLQSTVLSEEQDKSSPAPIKSEQETEQKLKLVQQTSNVIKNNCPVCPMYSQTHPVNVLEVTNQGFGSIAPANLPEWYAKADKYRLPSNLNEEMEKDRAAY